MEMKFHLTKSVATLAGIVVCFTVGCVAQSGEKPASLATDKVASGAAWGGQLPEALAAVLPKVKAKSQIPVLLPSKLPQPVAKAKNALVEKASANEYTISLYYELGIGDAGFAASFSAQTTPNYNPRDLKGIHEVKLVRGIRGFFKPISCRGSCSPANLWWEEHGILYQIQVKLPSSLSEQKQQDVIGGTADSSILGGPR
jgi:hypothetical protein